MFNKDASEVKFRIPYTQPKIPVFTLFSEKDLKKIELSISKTLKELTKQNISIVLCQHYLDSIVNEYLIKKLNTLERINNLNMEQIQHTFLRRATDKKEYQVLLELLEEQITSTESELTKLIDLYNNANPLYNGKLDKDTVTGSYKVKAEETDDE